jgi:hypothetical protein
MPVGGGAAAGGHAAAAPAAGHEDKKEDKKGKKEEKKEEEEEEGDDDMYVYWFKLVTTNAFTGVSVCLIKRVNKEPCPKCSIYSIKRGCNENEIVFSNGGIFSDSI